MNLNYLLPLILACFVTNTVGRTVIIDGDKAGFNQFPYLVTLLFHDRVECGGGILGDQHILTAAHCVVRNSGHFINYNLTVLVGTNDVTSRHLPAVTGVIKKIYVPAEYNGKRDIPTGDIAVVKLKNPLGLSKHTHLQHLRLPKNKDETYIGKTGKIAGFGWDWIKVDVNKETGNKTDPTLLYGKGEVLSSHDKHYFQDIDPDKHICARIKQHHFHQNRPRGVCNGDSGGPLVVSGNVVIGILSISPTGCSEKYFGAIYTRVTSFVDFIRDAMNDHDTNDIHTHELHT